jgi:hypothetical protein
LDGRGRGCEGWLRWRHGGGFGAGWGLKDEDGAGGTGEVVVGVGWVGERSRHAIECYDVRDIVLLLRRSEGDVRTIFNCGEPRLG